MSNYGTLFSIVVAENKVKSSSIVEENKNAVFKKNYSYVHVEKRELFKESVSIITGRI